MTTTTTASPSIQQVAIEKAIKFLTAAKAAFAVQMPDGSFVGDLVVLTKTRRRKVNNWCLEMPGYIQKIQAMQIGDVLSWEVESRERGEAFRSAASSQGSQLYGKGAFMTTVSENSVEALRVG
jgi:hypothetical protein